MTHSPATETHEPGLHLVLGPPNAGKLGMAMRWWEELQASHPLVVVPSQTDVGHVQAELLERVPVVFDARPVCTFDRLVSLISPGSRPVLSDVRRALLIADLLSRDREGVLGSMSRHPGARQAVAALIDELGESGLDAKSVHGALRSAADRTRDSFFRDVSALLAEYGDAVAGIGRVDRHQALLEAVKECGSWERPVAFHGFFSFTAAQRRLVLDLAASVPVLVTLAVSSEREVSAHAAQEARRLRNDARSSVVLPRQDLVFSSPAIAHLERSFLVPGAGPLTSAGGDSSLHGAGPPSGGSLEGVWFLLSAGRRQEVETVAAEIVSLLRGGVDPGDVAVLLREVAPWQRLVREVFDRFGVPHVIDGHTEFGATGLGHALLRALRGLACRDPYDLITYLRTPYHPASLHRADAAEVQLRGRSVVPGPGALEALEDLLPGEIDRVRRAVLLEDGEVIGLSDRGLHELAAAMVAAAARSRGLSSPDLEEDARALATLNRALHDVGQDRTHGEGESSASTEQIFARSFETGVAVLSSLPVALTSGDALGVVTVSSVRRVRARRFPVVFVLGLVDGEFPGQSTSVGLFTQGQRERLVRAEGEPLLPLVDRSEDASLFALSISRAWQLLYLSARDAEDDGSEILPSPFWAEARRLLAADAVLPRRGLADVVFAPDDAPTAREYMRACAARGLLPADPHMAERLERLPAWECRPASLSEPLVLDVLASRDAFSATEIESYVACPYRWFAERVVGLNAMEESLGGLQGGSIAHRVLKEVYEDLLAEGVTRVTPGSLGRALDLAAAALERAAAGLHGSFGEAGERLLLRDVEKRIRWFLESESTTDSSLCVSELESSLPKDGVPLGSFSLTGRVDRIDEDPESGAMVVVDYKYGSSVSGPDFVKKGALQIPLYLLALRSSRPGREVAGGVYVALGGRQVRGAVLDRVAERGGAWLGKASVTEEEFEDRLREALTAAEKAVEGIRAGRIQAEPLNGCPPFCDLRPLCRVRGGRATW